MDYECEIVDVLYNICKNPLIFVSEADLQYLVMAGLMKIPELNRLYPTNCTIGMNQYGKPSKEKYKTRRVHKEYGHHDMPSSRSDLVILGIEDVKNIVDPLNLRVSDNKSGWIIPEYMFEFGTEKSAKSEAEFKEHLCSDISKVTKSKEKGYVIHIQRNICKSKGEKLSNNRSKYEGYSKVIKEACDQIKDNKDKVKVLVILINIGNEGRRISKEGKIKIFENDKFVGIDQNKVKEEIRNILR